MGDSPKWVKSKKRRKKKRERAKVGDNYGQATHGARKLPGPKKRVRLNYGNNNGQAMHDTRKHAWRTQATFCIK